MTWNAEDIKRLSRLNFYSKKTLSLELSLRRDPFFNLIREIMTSDAMYELHRYFISASAHSLTWEDLLSQVNLDTSFISELIAPELKELKFLILPENFSPLTSKYPFLPLLGQDKAVLLPLRTLKGFLKARDTEMRTISLGALYLSSYFHFRDSLEVYHYMNYLLRNYPAPLLKALGEVFGKKVEVPPHEYGRIRISLSWLSLKVFLASLKYALFSLHTLTEEKEEGLRAILRGMKLLLNPELADLPLKFSPALSLNEVKEPAPKALELTYPFSYPMSSYLELELEAFIERDLEKLKRGKLITLEEERRYLERVLKDVPPVSPKPSLGTTPAPHLKAQVKRVEPRVPRGKRGPKFCPRCGARVPEGAIFCHSCGLDLRPYYS